MNWQHFQIPDLYYVALCTAAKHKVLNLDDYVFTTEAHPLLRAKKTEPSNRFQRFLGK